ncbi:MAG: SDR family oxidoreductase [Eggerthellaceae bacterium]|nr:SDR family oxidoreductase [Eggerthellaceae bacterium]
MPDSFFSMPSPITFDSLLSLDKKVAIVTGWEGEVSRAIVERLAQAGAHVVVGAADDNEAEEITSMWGQTPQMDVTGVACDPADERDRDLLIERTYNTQKRMDILVNCPGAHPFGNSFGVTAKDWDEAFDRNAKAPFFMACAVAHKMIKADEGGRIINLISRAVTDADPASSLCTLSESPVLEMTRMLAKEFAPYRITVNSVTAGSVLTAQKARTLQGMQAGADSSAPVTGSSISSLVRNAGTDEDVETVMRKSFPLGRMGTAFDIADAVLYLATDMSFYMTGQNLVLDGAQEKGSFPDIANLGYTKDLDEKADEALSALNHGLGSEEDDVKVEHSPVCDEGLGGFYEADVDSPMGEQKMSFDFSCDGQELTGHVNFMGRDYDIEDGHATTAGFTFVMQVKMMVKKIEAQVSGVREGDVIKGVVKTNLGDMTFEGTRQPKPEGL